MSVSPIGASGVSALVLSRLMGNSNSSASFEDSSSQMQGVLDSLFVSPEAQWMNRSQEGSPFKADFQNLGSLLQSGDMSSAKSAYSAILEKMGSQKGGQDEASTAFAAIGKALESGDSSAAQSAWGNMQSNLAGMAGGQQSANPMQRDMDKLGSLISAGDLSKATTLFESLQSRFKAGESSEAGSSTTGQGSSLDSKFSTLEAALKAGDTGSAKTALTSLQEDLQKTPPPPPPPKGEQASSGVSDMDMLLLSSYLNSPTLTKLSSDLA